VSWKIAVICSGDHTPNAVIYFKFHQSNNNNNNNNNITLIEPRQTARPTQCHMDTSPFSGFGVTGGRGVSFEMCHFQLVCLTAFTTGCMYKLSCSLNQNIGETRSACPGWWLGVTVERYITNLHKF